jgi:hypothetical protein
MCPVGQNFRGASIGNLSLGSAVFEPLTDNKPVRQIGAADLIGRRPTPKG